MALAPTSLLLSSGRALFWTSNQKVDETYSANYYKVAI